VRWRGDLQDSSVSTAKNLRAFADGVEISQHASAIHEELLAFCG